MRLLIFFILLPVFSISQQVLNADQFFALALTDFQNNEKHEIDELNFPWIDLYEFRTETSDFDLSKQEYTMRLSPSSAKIRKAQNALYKEMKNAPDFDGQEIYCDLIMSLHIDWLDLFILKENQSALDEMLIILNDKESIYEKMLGTYEFDPEKLLKLYAERSDIEISMNKLNLESEFLLNKYNIQNQELDFEDFINVEAILDFLTTENLVLNKSIMLDSETEYERKLVMKEIELEKSENKQLVDFVQFKYNGPHSDPLQERLSVGLGFQLSNSGSKKLKMQELKIEQEELKRKSDRSIIEKQAQLITLENKLKSDLQAIFHFQKTMEEERTQLHDLSGKISQKEGSSPLLLLDIKERNLSMKFKSINQKEDLIKDYLKYLQQSDKMCQTAFTNYLKK